MRRFERATRVRIAARTVGLVAFVGLFFMFRAFDVHGFWLVVLAWPPALLVATLFERFLTR